MKRFNISKKELFKKTILILVFLILFNFIFANPSSAWSISGILIKPISTLLLTFLDSIAILVTTVLTGGDFLGLNDNTPDYDIQDLIDGGIFVGADDIFAGRVQILNAYNILNYSEPTGAAGTAQDILDIATLGLNPTGLNNQYLKNIKGTISGIYVVLRDMSLIILLIALIYVGIRIVLASNSAEQRARWKMLLVDWLKAFLLVLYCHIIMVLMFWINEKFVNAINTFTTGTDFIGMIRSGCLR